MKNAVLNTRLETKTARGKFHLVISGGGIKALIAGLGAIMGLHSKFKWKTIGAVSGGTIPAVFYAADLSLRRMMSLMVAYQFETLVQRIEHPLAVIRYYLGQKSGEKIPMRSMMCSDSLGALIDKYVPVWPAKLWIMAAAEVPGKGRCQVLFTAKGVFLYEANGTCTKLCDEPVPVGLAVQASIAIPGVIGAVQFMGMYLFDGMLTWDGRMPIGVVSRHFKVPCWKIVAVNIDGNCKKFIPRLQKRYMEYWRGVATSNIKTLSDWAAEGVKVFDLDIEEIGALELELTPAQKKAAIRKAYELVGDCMP